MHFIHNAKLVFIGKKHSIKASTLNTFTNCNIDKQNSNLLCFFFVFYSETLRNDFPPIFSEEPSGFDALRLPHSIHSPDRYSCTEPDKPFSHCVTHRGDQSRQHRLPWSVEDLCQENYTELGMRVSGDIL